MIQFPSLPQRLKFKRLNKDDLKQCEKIFDSFPMHSVHLLIPDSSAPFKTPPSKEKYEDILLSDRNVYFIVKNVAVTSLIQSDFLDHFVRGGLLLGLSNKSKIGTENFLSIISPGKLILYLEKNIAECLALHKENTQKKKEKKDFQTIIIDLTGPELQPGKKHYQYIHTELSKIDEIKFDLLLKWEPRGNVCPQSMKTYFISQGLECFTCKPKHKYSSKYSVNVPKISFDVPDAEVIKSFTEWIGMQICGIEYTTDKEEYASKLTVPECSEILSRLHKCSFEGFYSKTDLLSVIEEMSNVFEANPTLPFIVICVSGYQDSFVVANGFQYFSCDDKQICFIIFPSFKYWIIALNAV